MLNDAAELEYALPLVVGEIQERASELEAKVRESGDVLTTPLLVNVAQQLRHGLTADYWTLVACFCEDDDLLSQWRSYGKGPGYAIGFDTKALETNLLEAVKVHTGAMGSPHLVKVLYGAQAAEEAAARYIQQYGSYADDERGRNSHFQIGAMVLPLLASVKHPAFAEEREWRLVLTIMRPTFGIPHDAVPDFQFRAGSLGIIPYLDLELPPGAIREVVLGPGPHPEARQRGVTELARARYGRIPVRLSEAPLRT